VKSMYIVIDTRSRNVMGDFETLAEAKVLFLRLVAAAPQAYRDLLVLDEDWVEQPVSEEEVLAALRAAIA